MVTLLVGATAHLNEKSGILSQSARVMSVYILPEQHEPIYTLLLQDGTLLEASSDFFAIDPGTVPFNEPMEYDPTETMEVLA